MNIELGKYSNVIANKDLGEAIYADLSKRLAEFRKITLDLKGVDVMTTFCAKQIFGKLYLDIGPDDFFSRIQFLHANDDLRLIIEQSIQNAVDKQSSP
jgi:hypothetical protein